MTKTQKIIIVSVLLLIAVGAFLFFRHEVYYSHGLDKKAGMFSVQKGEGNTQIADNLKNAGFIKNKWYFYYYLQSHKLLNKIMPGDYNLSGSMTIPQIAGIITNTQKSFMKITFPEGLTTEEMGDVLAQNGFDKNTFLEAAKNVDAFRDNFSFLNDKNIKTLDGYLFPDTYFFSKDATAEGMISKILSNFELKFSSSMAEKIKEQNKILSQEIVMASLIQGEVKTTQEMKLVSGIFWKRLEIDMPLQSDTNYVTYDKKGLPEKPICNPGLDAITAAIYPQKSDYLYFVSNKETGETFFGRTFDEHKTNKIKAGY